ARLRHAGQISGRQRRQGNVAPRTRARPPARRRSYRWRRAVCARCARRTRRGRSGFDLASAVQAAGRVVTFSLSPSRLPSPSTGEGQGGGEGGEGAKRLFYTSSAELQLPTSSHRFPLLEIV